MRPTNRLVVVLLPYINSYRVPLLAGLRDRLGSVGIAFQVYSARPSGVDASRADAEQFDGAVLQQVDLRLGAKHLLLRALPPGWLSADVVVLEHAVKNLESHFILITRRLLRRKTMLWGHGSTITEPTSFATRVLQKLMVRLSFGYLAYTAGSAVRAEALGMSPDRVTVLNNSIDSRALATMCDESSRTDGPVLLYVGGLDGAKRIDRLIRVGAELASRIPDFRLIVGGRGELEDLMTDNAATWLDYRGSMDMSDKARAGNESAAMIITGRVGLAVVDAFAMGLPVVTTAYQYHAPEFEYLTEANSVVAPDDEEQLIAAAERLLTDPDALARLKRGARRSAQDLSIESMIVNFEGGLLRALS